MIATLDGRVDLFRGEVWLQRLGHGVRPGSYPFYVGLRKAEHGVDDGERDDEGVVGDQVDRLIGATG